jgi:hypothetical protein
MLTTESNRKLKPEDLVQAKPDVAAIFRQEMGRCGYDHGSETRHWTESEKIRRIIMSTGAPTSSTLFDGEGDE